MTCLGRPSDREMARLRAAYAMPWATSQSMYPDPNPFPCFRLFHWKPSLTRLLDLLVPASALRWGRLTGRCTCAHRFLGAHKDHCAAVWEERGRPAIWEKPPLLRLAEIDHAARGRRLAQLSDAIDGSGDKWGVIANPGVPRQCEGTRHHPDGTPYRCPLKLREPGKRLCGRCKLAAEETPDLRPSCRRCGRGLRDGEIPPLCADCEMGS